MQFFISDIPESELKKERTKAREMRKTQWWKRKCEKGVCYYCGKRFAPKDLTMDHIVPLIRGGKTTKGNVAPVCKDCNNKKKHMLPLEWDEYIERLNRETE